MTLHLKDGTWYIFCYIPHLKIPVIWFVESADIIELESQKQEKSYIPGAYFVVMVVILQPQPCVCARIV